ncbi:MAG: hypothetical protein RPR91_10680 [Colwellia sp.]
MDNSQLHNYFYTLAKININGTKKVLIHSGYQFDDLSFYAYKQVSVIDSDDLSTYTNDFYFYDNSGNQVHYLTSIENYYTNQGNPSDGVLKIPNSLYSGNEWISDPELLYFEGENYHGKRTYSVIQKETLSLQLGEIQSYKIIYTGEFEGPQYDLSINGTIWLHPNIGIIKTTENISRQYDVFVYSILIKTELVRTNWEI